MLVATKEDEDRLLTDKLEKIRQFFLSSSPSVT